MELSRFLPNFALESIYERNVMAQVEYITIKNASRKVLRRLRKIGEEKAQKSKVAQERWERGEYDKSQVVLI